MRGAESTTSRVREIWVGQLPVNRVAVQVYRACQWTVVGTMADVYHVGISGQEVRSVVELHRIEPECWPDVSERVRVMVDAARPLLNFREKS